MPESDWIGPIVERVVGQVLDNHVASVRAEIVRRVVEEIAAESAAHGLSGEDAILRPLRSAPDAADLARAVAEIQLGASQREILRALLDTGARYAHRIALFVVKGIHASGWQARGFADNDAVKDFALDENSPALLRAIVDRVSASATVADLDPRFLQRVGSPASGEALIFPLMLKEKVAALVYADNGTDGADAGLLNSGLLNYGALELLVLTTGAWLEVNSLRKQAHHAMKMREASTLHPHEVGDQPTFAGESAFSSPVLPPKAFPANDPFAAPPVQAMAAAASASFGPELSPAVLHPEFQDRVQDEVQDEFRSDNATEYGVEPATEIGSHPAPAETWPGIPADAPSDHAPFASAPGISSDLPSNLSPEEQEIHHKAQRFARLLVDDIKLYNQAAVVEGRKAKDLYHRLRDAIDKSRATYQKRYGNTVAASADYFHHEIIRSLAEQDPSIMGADFRQ